MNDLELLEDARSAFDNAIAAAGRSGDLQAFAEELFDIAKAVSDYTQVKGTIETTAY